MNYLTYMRCAILARMPIDTYSWDEATLRGVFSLLPPPQVDYPTWRERMNAEAFPSEHQQRSANDRFIAFARKFPELLQMK